MAKIISSSENSLWIAKFVILNCFSLYLQNSGGFQNVSTRFSTLLLKIEETCSCFPTSGNLNTHITEIGGHLAHYAHSFTWIVSLVFQRTPFKIENFITPFCIKITLLNTCYILIPRKTIFLITLVTQSRQFNELN